MKRSMGEFVVEQRTLDGMFNATNLLGQWNKRYPDKKRRLDKFWDTTHLYEFMIEVVKDPKNGLNLPESNSPNLGDLKNVLSVTTRGKFGGTWMQPYLFMKFAMYLNPAFEYQVVKFVSDELISFRHDIGDGYKKMCKALSKELAAGPRDYIRVAKALNWIVYNEHSPDLRQRGDVQLIKKMDEMQRKVCFMLEMGYVRSMDNLVNELRKVYKLEHGRTPVRRRTYIQHVQHVQPQPTVRLR